MRNVDGDLQAGLLSRERCGKSLGRRRRPQERKVTSATSLTQDVVEPCVVRDPEHVLIYLFVIDFDEKTVRPTKDSLVRKISKIRHIGHIENKLVLQGVEEGVENVDDGLAWSIAISKKTGKVVLSASGNGVAYVVFGTCTAVQDDWNK